MGMSTTVKTRLGDVTIAAHGKCDQEGPRVLVAITMHLMTYPVPMTPAQARGLAAILSTAATSAELEQHTQAVTAGPR